MLELIYCLFRPKWNERTTPEQLDQLEKDNFLAWRRSLAEYVFVVLFYLVVFISWSFSAFSKAEILIIQVTRKR